MPNPGVEEAGNFHGVPVFVTDGTRANILARCDALKKFNLFNLPGFGTRAVNKVSGEVFDFALGGGATPRLDLLNLVIMGAGVFAAACRREMTRQLEQIDNHAAAANISVLSVANNDISVLSVADRTIGILCVADRARMFTRQER